MVARLVAVTHLLGEDLATRAGRLERALATVPEDAAAAPVRAALLRALAAAYMLDRRLEEAIGYGERSLAAAGDDTASLNTAATLGSVLVEYDRAERWLAVGIDYAERVELWNHRHYMAAHLAHVQWAVGRWELADRTAEHALADGRGGITTRITAEHVLGYLAMGRGEWARAGELLGDALRQGEAMAELQRLSPALWGLAETALLRGDHEAAIALCDRGQEASDRVGDAAYLFPFLVTGVRARLAGPGPDEAERWLAEVAGALAARSIPGTLVAVTTAGACSSWPGATSRPPGRRWTAPPPGGPSGAGSGRALGPGWTRPAAPSRPVGWPRRPPWPGKPGPWPARPPHGPSWPRPTGCWPVPPATARRRPGRRSPPASSRWPG